MHRSDSQGYCFLVFLVALQTKYKLEEKNVPERGKVSEDVLTNPSRKHKWT